MVTTLTSPTNYTLRAPTIHVNFTPFALAKMSNGIFRCSVAYKATDIVLLNYFLFCASIELGLKAAILSIGNSATAKEEMKRIGHDLVKAYARFRTSFPANDLLDANDQAALAKINPFFKKKGLEYITGDVVEALMNGLSAFPSETEILTAAQKVNSFLQEQDYFKNC